MKIAKKIILYFFLLLMMILCGTAILKIFDLLLNLEYENIWISGLKVGFVAWIGTLINEFHHYIKEKKNR